MSVDAKIDKIESARNTIRSKMVAAGQASSSDKLADLANNLKFYTAGDGINIDQSNEISTNRMESSEIDDLDLDGAGQPSGMVIDLDGNELVVGTVIQNGVRKPLYQKTYMGTFNTTPGLRIIDNAFTNKAIVKGEGIVVQQNLYPLVFPYYVSSNNFATIYQDGNVLYVNTEVNNNSSPYTLTVQYTKTT